MKKKKGCAHSPIAPTSLENHGIVFQGTKINEALSNDSTDLYNFSSQFFVEASLISNLASSIQGRQRGLNVTSTDTPGAKMHRGEKNETIMTNF